MDKLLLGAAALVAGCFLSDKYKKDEKFRNRLDNMANKAEHEADKKYNRIMNKDVENMTSEDAEYLMKYTDYKEKRENFRNSDTYRNTH